MHAIELIAIILDHIIVLPFLGAGGLTAPGARAGAGAGCRLRLGFALSGIVLAAREAQVGAFRVDHFAAFA